MVCGGTIGYRPLRGRSPKTAILTPHLLDPLLTPPPPPPLVPPYPQLFVFVIVIFIVVLVTIKMAYFVQFLSFAFKGCSGRPIPAYPFCAKWHNSGIVDFASSGAFH